jgi:nucleotide-binding universal stress UspA family protein
MSVIAVVSQTTRSDRVLFEAADRADALGADVHVVYVLGVGRYTDLVVRFADRIGVPIGIERIRAVCERRAEAAAAPIVENYETAGLVGEPVEEVVRYARLHGADCIVVDGNANWNVDVTSLLRDSTERFRETDVSVVPVY